jgi:3-deoxy-manno-octulosonate cytidylyltransferase (CMP-KDO synthetase)
MASSRLHAKPLAELDGVPLVRHVVARAMGSRAERVLVATDSDEIARSVDGTGCEVAMTSPDHCCGTDRIAEVAAGLAEDYVVNLQGDQLIPGPSALDSLIEGIGPGTGIATCYAPVTSPSDLDDRNVVKVALGEESRVVYMSRLPVPFDRAGRADARELLRQIGIYVFERQALLDFAALEPTELEKREGIELLRALARGLRLTGIRLDFELCDVDVEADLDAARGYLARYPLAPASS